MCLDRHTGEKALVFYRFVANGVGIYEAVDKYCPRTDLRRNGKPDGSWLPRVGERYAGAISFWTEAGLARYLNSGLQEWHRSVIESPLEVLVTDEIGAPVYRDEFQVICEVGDLSVRKVPWERFGLDILEIPFVEKVVAYVIRGEGDGAEVLVFEHGEPFSESWIQVPAGTVNNGELTESAALREAQEESGLADLTIVAKIDEYFLYRRFPPAQFHRRHVYLMKAGSATPDRWVHEVTGDGEDNGMRFNYYWMSIDEAAHRLAGSFGCSIRKVSN